MTGRGRTLAFVTCLNRHGHKILVAGNHDDAIEKHPELIPKLLPTTHYLQDSGVEIGGVKFWGSPWTPRFHGGAFMLDRGSSLRSQWGLIPDDTDVLITHGPPYLSGGRAIDGMLIINVGCEELYYRTRDMPLQTHVFGHIPSPLSAGLFVRSLMAQTMVAVGTTVTFAISRAVQSCSTFSIVI